MFSMDREGDQLLLYAIKKYVVRGSYVLEVGAGNCSFLEKVVEEFGVVGYGVDPFISTRSIGNLKCLSMVGEEISELDVKFPLIYLIRSFHHISNVRRFLLAALSVLLPEGKLIIVDWKKGTKTGVPEYYYDIQEVTELMLNTSYKIVEAKEGKWNFLVVGEPTTTPHSF